MTLVLPEYMRDGTKKRIVVAMSGGVDSSCVAALLHDQGHEVIGMTMQLYDAGQNVPSREGSCCAGQDIYDAKRVAANLGINHYVLNYESRFNQAVIQDFADSYARGETPIPCVKCNQTVKFRDLLTQARTLGAEALATGHYVRREWGQDGWQMHCGHDRRKDQSYFLYSTTREQLDNLWFPLGGMSKSETRALAEHHGLPNADKPDSQDICFVTEQGGYAKIVERYRADALRPGNIVDAHGQVLGQHQGVIFYTVGQRRGLGVGGQEQPLYVLAVDAQKAEVMVGPYEALAVSEVLLREVNWLLPAPESRNVQVKFRSRMQPIDATLIAEENTSGRVVFTQPQHGISAGQACVFYAQSRVLGGGVIRQTVARSSSAAA